MSEVNERPQATVEGTKRLISQVLADKFKLIWGEAGKTGMQLNGEDNVRESFIATIASSLLDALEESSADINYEPVFQDQLFLDWLDGEIGRLIDGEER